MIIHLSACRVLVSSTANLKSWLHSILDKKSDPQSDSWGNNYTSTASVLKTDRKQIHHQECLSATAVGFAGRNVIWHSALLAASSNMRCCFSPIFGKTPFKNSKNSFRHSQNNDYPPPAHTHPNVHFVTLLLAHFFSADDCPCVLPIMKVC